MSVLPQGTGVSNVNLQQSSGAMAWVLDEVRHPDLLDFKAPCVTTVYDWDKPSSPRPPARAAAVAPREASADPDAHGQQPYRIPAAAPVADSDTADGLNDDCQNTAAVEPLSLPALPYNSGIASILSLFSPTSSATADSQASCAPQLLHVSAPSAPEQASGSTCAASASKPPDASPHAIAHAEELAALGTEEAKQAESAGKSTPASRHPDAIRPSQLKVATTGRHAASAAHEQAATADGILLDNVSPAQQHSDAGRTTNLGTATAASSQDTTQDPASTTVQQQSAAADMTAPPAAAADTSAKPLAASTIHLDAACLQRVADQVGMRADCVKAADDALNQVLGNPSCQQDTVLRDPVQSTNGIIKAAMEAMLQSAPLRNRRTSDSGAQTVPSATQAADMDVTRLGSCTVRRRPSSASGAQTTQTVPALVPAADAGLSSTCDSCHPEVVAASAQQCIHSADHTTGHSGSGSKAITVLDTQLPVLQEVIPGVDQQIYEGHLKDTLSNSGKSFASPTKRDAERPSSDAANAAHGRKEPAQAAVAADSASISEPRLNHPHISTGAAVNETPDTTAKDAAADATALATADFHKQKRNESEVFGSIELTADESTGDGSSATNLGPELATSPAAQDVGQESQSLQEPMLDVVARVPAINEHPSSHEVHFALLRLYFVTMPIAHLDIHVLRQNELSTWIWHKIRSSSYYTALWAGSRSLFHHAESAACHSIHGWCFTWSTQALPLVASRC